MKLIALVPADLRALGNSVVPQQARRAARDLLLDVLAVELAEG